MMSKSLINGPNNNRIRRKSSFDVKNMRLFVKQQEDLTTSRRYASHQNEGINQENQFALGSSSVEEDKGDYDYVKSKRMPKRANVKYNAIHGNNKNNSDKFVRLKKV